MQTLNIFLFFFQTLKLFRRAAPGVVSNLLLNVSFQFNVIINELVKGHGAS